VATSPSRLGKRLIELSRVATAQGGDPSLTPGEHAVLEDALTNAESSVSDISARTGFVQSHVSVSVAQLKQRGLVETRTDPADGRRTRVRVTGVAVRAVTARAGRDVNGAIVADAEQARRVSALLDEVARLLLM
jgi:DNA-binding MarR family transcriptional regulator